MIRHEKQQLQQQFIQYKEQLSVKEKEYEQLKTIVKNRDTKAQILEKRIHSNSFAEEGVAKSSFISVLFLTIAMTGFLAYSFTEK